VKLRTMIVEDEPLALRALRGFVAEVEWLEFVGEAQDGARALETIDRLRPELVFLDVQIPLLSGLEVLRRVQHVPEVVFTTAYDRYAVAAFELGALDYLVKPFGRERFQRALERVRARMGAPSELPPASERVRSALDGSTLRRLFARGSGGITPISVDTVVRFEARGDYVAIHHTGGTSLLHVSLGELAARLDAERFFRVHRSHIVNLDRVRTIRACDERRFLIVLDDGTEILASRAGSQRLRERLS
jgi:two-component system LytT family response regulator